MGDFQKLNVWQKSKDLAVYLYKLSNEGDLAKDFGLKDQIKRASVSIAANIAEGEQLQSNLQAIRHFYIARGSAAELLTHLIIAHEINYITKMDYQDLQEKINEISGMLTNLIKARQNSKPK